MTPEAAQQIIAEGHTWEDVVAARLRNAGYQVAPYGQRLLTDDEQDVVRAFGPHLRYAPDFLVIGSNGRPVAIDAKWTRHSSRGTHVVNVKARHGFMDFVEHYDALGLFAFNHAPADSLKVGVNHEHIGFMTVADWQDHGPRPGLQTANGSGEPYEVVDCACYFPDWGAPG